LWRVAAALALDYAGIDFALARDGSLLLFEANATMIMPPPPADAIWDYRRAPIARAVAAARRLADGKLAGGKLADAALAMAGCGATV
jgi:hypothetical protein